MNNFFRFCLVVLGFTSFSASAPPGALGRMWAKLTCRSDCDAVKPVHREGARHASGPVVETLTEVRNPYHETRKRISEAPGELRKQARGMRAGARMLDSVHDQADEQRRSGIARSNRAIRLDAGGMMMRTRGASKGAKDGALAVDNRVVQAQDVRLYAGRKFRAQDKKGKAWAKGDENPTTL